MHELRNLGIRRQHREHLLRGAEARRLAKGPHPSRMKRARPLPAWPWEMKRYGGRVAKLLGKANDQTRKGIGS